MFWKLYNGGRVKYNVNNLRYGYTRYFTSATSPGFTADALRPMARIGWGNFSLEL